MQEKEIIKEVKKALTNEKSKDPNLVSLFMVASRYRYAKKQYLKVTNYVKTIDEMPYTEMYVDFDYLNNYVNIRYYEGPGGICETFILKKDEEGELVLTGEHGFFANEYKNHIIRYFKSYLSYVYKQFENFKDFYNQSNEDIKIENSNLECEINCSGVSIYNKEDFELKRNSINYEDEIKANSIAIFDAFDGLINIEHNKNDIFKYLFIKIDDLPNWCREDIRKLRKYELEEGYTNLPRWDLLVELRDEDEKKKQEKKKKEEKILKIKKKLFPFKRY